MRAFVLVLLVAASAIARAAPSEEGRAVVFVVDRALAPAKLEIVRQAVKGSSYRDDDQIGVVAFGGTKAEVVLRLAFEALKTLDTTEKRVVLFGTGRGEHVAELVKEMAAAGITVSAVGDREADRAALDAITKGGNGRLEMHAKLGMR